MLKGSAQKEAIIEIAVNEGQQTQWGLGVYQRGNKRSPEQKERRIPLQGKKQEKSPGGLCF